MSATVVASAPGKVILAGEHAVVYGATALAVSVDLRTFCILKLETGTRQVQIDLPDVGKSRSWALSEWKQEPSTPSNPTAPSEGQMEVFQSMSGEDAQYLVPVLFLLTGIMDVSPSEGISLSVQSYLPHGAGLGSSAAFSVAIATALLGAAGVLAKREFDENDRLLINKWAFEAEKILHGRPSGIDNTTSTFGGAVALSSGQPKYLQGCKKLRILITNTKVARSTSKLVQGVRERRNRFPHVIDPIISSLSHLSTECIAMLCEDGADKHLVSLPESQDQQLSTQHVAAGSYESLSSPPRRSERLSSEEEEKLSELFSVAHHLLNGLGVGHRALDTIVSVAAGSGQFASKLTGAGGGGCAITLVPNTDDAAARLSAVQSELASLGFECFECGVGGEGAIIHDQDDPRVRDFYLSPPSPARVPSS